MTEDTPGGDGGEGFLSRWSRRKQQVARQTAPGRAEAKPAPPAGRDPVQRDPVRRDPAGPGADERAEPSATATVAAEPEIDLSKLPKLDELTADTDYTQFLARGVPEELRTAALREAWRLDPKIRDFIEVAENQWDFNAPDGVPGFGELAPGTNLDALLAQATGRAPAPEPPPEVAVAEAPSSPEAAPTSHAAPQNAPQDGDQEDPTVLAEAARHDSEMTQVEASPRNSGIPDAPTDAPVEHKPILARRRHGRALPG